MPLHWEKVKTTRDNSVVWNKLNTSFQLDPQSLEAMFGVQKTSPPRKSTEKAGPSNRPDHKGILDARKAHNLAIQLRGLRLTRNEVCDALLEGEGLSSEVLEILVKVAPSDEEKRRFEEFDGDEASLEPSDRFMYEVLRVPNAWSRLGAMLYKAQYKEDLPILMKSLETLKVASKDLKESRTFRKLLEAVLKTGNRLNMGTYRGDAQAFKLDSLLKLADVKGVDNKTTLLDFVIQEISKSESANVARLTGNNAPINTPSSPVSPTVSDFSATLKAAMQAEDAQSKMRMGMVTGLPEELASVREAGGIDWQLLHLSIQKLVQEFQRIKAQVEEGKYVSTTAEAAAGLARNTFQHTMEKFIEQAEADITAVQQELSEVTQAVKLVNVYFYGIEALRNDSEPLKVFLIVKEFLNMLEQACKDWDNPKAAGKSTLYPSPLIL